MRILQVMAGASHGGAETAFVDMCLAMAEAGQDVEVVTRANPLRVRQMRDAGLKVHTLPFGGALDFYTPFKIGRIIAKFKPDIVQTWMARASWKTPGRDPKSKTPPYKTVARLGGYYKMKYFENTDYFITITPDIRRYLIEEGVPSEKVEHINNFAETEQADKPVDRAALDTPDDASALLALGRLHPAKAFDVLLRAVHDVPGVYLWIAGEGPQREELEALCDDLALNDRVRFLGWRDDRAALFQAADICVFPSRYEPFGTVFVQSWAQNVPVITSDADGPRQYVRDGEDGLVVPRDDVTALAQAIARLKDDGALQARLVANGRKRYEDEFTREKAVESYLDFYKKIIKNQ